VDLESVLNAIDFGVIVCNEDGDQVVFGNTWAKSAVPGIASEPALLPVELRAAIDEDLDARGFLTEFSRTHHLTLNDGRKLSMRFKCLGSEQRTTGFLLLLSRARLRRDDLYSVLNQSFGLTKRTCDIAMMIRDGYRNEEIATQLNLAVGTVKHYVHRLFTAVDVRSRSELVRFLDKRTRDTTHGG